MRNKYYHKATRIKKIRPMSNVRKRELLAKANAKVVEAPIVEESTVEVEELQAEASIEEQVVETEETVLETEEVEAKPKRNRRKKVADEETDNIQIES